jgi:hypothetical protein
MTLLTLPPTPAIDTYEDVDLHEFSSREWRVYDVGFLTGYALGQASRQAQLDQANRDADRYYAEMCRRPAPREKEQVSYAELCRRRGDYERAERNEAQLRELFGYLP